MAFKLRTSKRTDEIFRRLETSENLPCYILKMLKSEPHLADKEYPLVLDGPFSKLYPDQRQNVVDVIPQFAPQIILFSKDSLQDIFAEEQIGHVWTISSNAEKNIACIKEGYHWN